MAKGTGFERHVRACNNAGLPGARLPFLIGEHAVGWVLPAVADALARFDGIVRSENSVALLDPAALPAMARTLADRGLCRWRGEAFDVRPSPAGPALTFVDRGAVPLFGVQAVGVHVNGLVRRADGLHVWVARRAADKLLDPGKLDHIVAGGVARGLSPWQTLIKEAAEEAAIPPERAGSAVLAGQFGYAMERQEGLRRDYLYCYDLDLPESFTPSPADGEVEAFECWPIGQVYETVRDTDDFKFNVNLVLIDLFIRLDMIEASEAARLRARLRPLAAG